MRKLTLPLLAIAMLLCAAGPASGAEAETFQDRYREVRDQVRSKKVTEAVIRQVEKLTEAAQNAAQRVDAFELLADAHHRAENYQKAARAWRDVFNLQIQRDREDQAQRAFEAARAGLRELQRIRPRPAEDMEEAARQALAWDDAARYTPGQKMELIGFIIEAKRSQGDRKAVVPDIERMVATAEYGEDIRVHLLTTIADLATDAGLNEKADEYCQRILNDRDATARQRGAAWLYRARLRERENRAEAAIGAMEAAVKEYDRAVEQDQGLEWHQMDSLRWAAAIARDDLLDYDKAMMFLNKLAEYADSPYWEVPARLGMAMTYRKQADYEAAEAEYQKILDMGDDGTRALIPHAEMVYYDLGAKQRGLKLLREAFHNEQINQRERYNALFDLAEALQRERDYEAALEWLSRVPELPTENERDRKSYATRAYYRLGEIQMARNNRRAAKGMFRKAMNLEGGDMGWRVRARDKLEDIRYFE